MLATDLFLSSQDALLLPASSILIAAGLEGFYLNNIFSGKLCPVAAGIQYAPHIQMGVVSCYCAALELPFKISSIYIFRRMRF
jgi:hypothetical protein